MLAAASSTGLVATASVAESARAVSASADKGAKLTRSDTRFLEKAYEATRHDITLAKLAADRASDQRVREYARTLSGEFSKLDAGLQRLVTEHGANLQTTPIDLEAFAAIGGTKFDERFLEEVVANQKDTVALYEDAIDDSSSPQIRTFAAQALPNLQTHLARAKMLERVVD